MDCKKVIEELPAYVEGDMDKALLNDLDRHLKECDRCKKEHAGLLAAWDMLDAWDDVVPPDRLRKNVLGSLPKGRQISWMKIALPVAAGFILVLGVALYYAGLLNGKAGVVSGTAGTGLSVDRVRVSDEEIIANLDLLEEEEFFDAMEELVRIDYLPLLDEPSGSTDADERSFLEIALT